VIPVAWVALLGCLALLAWTYVGYPAWLLMLARWKPRRPAKAHWQPHVTVCMAVHNGIEYLDAKIDGLLAHDYPADRLDMVVVSDGSNDGTGARLRERASERLAAIDAPVRRGKTACLADAIGRAPGEVLLFTDVRQRLAPGSVQALCDALATGELAAVSGLLRLERADGYAQSVDAYWRYETAIRSAEAATGSVVGVSGALYAVRKRDMPVPPAGLVLDDVWVPMRIAANGGRIGLEPAAVAYDRASASAAVESGRKRRTLSGNWQLLARWPAMALPGRHPLAWRFIHHKLLRLLAPLFLLGAFVANAALLGEGAFATALFVAQGLAYAAALAGLQWPALRAVLPVKLASAFLEMNAYAVLGFIDFLRSRDAHLWAAAPSALPPSPPRP
jgi:cellulose synthase/poly-beta-1,6-N-acetylglucosamine synthase-like glycosyltransferase